ncbi:WW domain-binding protein 4 [Epargyreus clarus]|uniref:WW domain-binding protein 4 n=1 Tax=Epargyreus clarus TaxID=520877 RepID=UPI003C3068AB
MTEYWKSQARKYCEFCKCWYADNKVSISFHENGKRHKENVQKHISQLSKKSAKEFKQKEKIDDDMKKMEAAAMSAYLKDVQNNADLTSKSINEMLEQSGSNSKNIVVSNAPEVKKKPLWHEVKSEDGQCYFWNTETNETTWDPPDDYLSVADQEKNKLKEQESEKKAKKMKKQKEKEARIEVKAHIAREQMKELAVKKDPPPSKIETTFGPAPRASNPYGSWKPVVNETEQNVDLQLPKVKEIVPPVVLEPERIQFKEKRVDSLGEGPVEFKKRKANLMVIFVALAVLATQTAAKPQVLLGSYGYYPAYVASYGTAQAYSYPYAYAYSYPLAYY